MQFFNPAKELSDDNYAILAEYGWFHENLIRSEYFGSARDYAEWLDAFDYESGDVFGCQGDGATMRAVESFRKESAYVAIPEYITEYNTNTGTSEIIGADKFHELRRMFQRDPDYRVNRHYCGNAKVHSVMYVGDGEPRLSSYVWHVPFGADELYA